MIEIYDMYEDFVQNCTIEINCCILGCITAKALLTFYQLCNGLNSSSIVLHTLKGSNDKDTLEERRIPRAEDTKIASQNDLSSYALATLHT